jgi:hypothetical protein
MRNTHAQASELKTRLILAAVTVAVMIVLAGSKENVVRGAGNGPVPHVTSITKVTHDGYRKASLLADDSQLYVTELPASNRVIAKVSLARS